MRRVTVVVMATMLSIVGALMWRDADGTVVKVDSVPVYGPISFSEIELTVEVESSLEGAIRKVRRVAYKEKKILSCRFVQKAIIESRLRDPWGEMIWGGCNGVKRFVASAGKDKKRNTADDIVFGFDREPAVVVDSVPLP